MFKIITNNCLIIVKHKLGVKLFEFLFKVHNDVIE